MTAVASARTRPVFLARTGDTFRLSFRFHPSIVERVKSTLPYATYEPNSRSWTTPVCEQSVQGLRAMFYDGLLDTAVDELVQDGEELVSVKPASLGSGTPKRPFVVSIAMRGDGTYEKLQAVPGASWDKKSHSLTFSAQAAVALGEFAVRGLLDDPEKLLSPAETVVAFDTRTGRFAVRGTDPRAAAAFEKHFPGRDVVSGWRERGLDVAFSDVFTEEVYRGELARVAPLREYPEINTTLLDYQRRNVGIALERTGFAILDEPGLGKTVQAIAVGARLLAEGTVPRVCVLVPASVRTQWKSEIQRFTGAGDDDVVVVRGTPAQRARAFAAAANARWLVVHYDILSKDRLALAPLFSGALVVADEGHRLKSWNSARTKAALALARSAARRLALSGTPMETSVAEWYQVLSGFAVPGFLGSPDDFNVRYRHPTKFGYEGSRNLAELRERSRPHYGRHLKADVAQQLPPLRIDQLILDPDATYAAALRRAHAEAAEEIEKHNAATRGQAAEEQQITGGLFGEDDEETEKVGGSEMNAVGQLRLLCSSPQLVLRSASQSAAAVVAAGLVPDIDGPKLDELRVMAAEFRGQRDARVQSQADDEITTCAQAQQERFVVFTSFKSMARLIAERFDEDGIPYVLYTGDVSGKARDAAVAAFTDPSSDVTAFIATDAAAEGLNLGKCCSTLIQFDPPWTPSRSQQRVNRIHRIDGTAERYRVINMVLANTLEVGVYRLLGQRADLQDSVLGETDTRYKATGRRTKSANVFEEAMSSFTSVGTSAHDRTRRARTPAAAPVPADGPAPALPAAGVMEQPTLFG